jgi:glycosyltransferase involved in cell wall biosynthesis
MSRPQIRCVVPTLNSAQTLDATLLSLRSQRDVDVDVLVVDSGSTDGTLDVCRRWDVPTLFEPPGNMYRAINAGLRSATSEWVTYLNSDDWLYADAYTRLAGHACETDSELVYGHCDYSDAVGRFAYSFKAAPPQALGGLFSAALHGFAQPATLFRRELFDRLGGFDENYRFSGDAHFFARATLGGARIARLNGRPVACFRLHEAQFTQRRKVEITAENENIRRLFADRGHGAAWLARTQWRLANAPHYAIRILRETTLARRLSLPRSIDRYASS